jgi:hypothetical protein
MKKKHVYRINYFTEIKYVHGRVGVQVEASSPEEAWKELVDETTTHEALEAIKKETKPHVTVELDSIERMDQI